MDFQLRHPQTTQINDHLWLLNDNDEATGYVLAGTKKAVVIDTMVGFVNVREEASRLTTLPLELINTHGHFDHIGGNWSFDRAFMNLADKELARQQLEQPQVKDVLARTGLTFPRFEHISDGMRFDLGNLELQAFYLPGHTPGEIVLLDRADRILFSGDGIIEQLWLQLPESLPVSAQAQSMRRLLPFRKEFDFILSGHSRAPHPAELFDTLLSAVTELASTDTANDEEYTWFGGISKAHPYGPPPRKIVYKG